MSALFIGNARIQTKMDIPLCMSKVKAGFPSSSQDYLERALNLIELCIRYPNTTVFVQVGGDSMIDAEIHDNDVVVVARSINAMQRDIVVAGNEYA